jgi:hypothetical protein
MAVVVGTNPESFLVSEDSEMLQEPSYRRLGGSGGYSYFALSDL